jgi:hypothetical protein
MLTSISRCKPWLSALLFTALTACDPAPVEEPTPVAPVAPTASPAALLLFPNTVFTQRVVELQFIGERTHFSSASRVDLGDPAIHTEVHAHSPGRLLIRTTLDGDTRLGTHDLKIITPVDTGSEEVSLPEALTVLPALRAEPAAQAKSVPQGGLIDTSVLNHDFRDNPFSTNSISIVRGPRLLRVNGVSAYRYAWLGLADALAPKGPLEIVLSAVNPIGERHSFRAGRDDLGLPLVQLRAPTLLEDGQLLTGQRLPEPMATNLYRYEADVKNNLLFVQLEKAEAAYLQTGPILAVAPASGRFAQGAIVPAASSHDGLVTSMAYIEQPGTTYFSLLAPDYSGGALGYGYAIRATSLPVIPIELREPAGGDTPARPLVNLTISQAVASQSAAIEPSTDMDYIRFTPEQDGYIYAQAAGDPPLATRVAVLQADCSTVIGTPRTFQQEAEVQAGVAYCVRVSATAATPYRLLLVLQPKAK